MGWFKKCEQPHGAGLVHFTLSMPEGLRLSNQEWHTVATYVLERSGLPADRVPWIMVGRESTRCDHSHIVSSRQTWSGRELEIATSKRFTDALDRDLRHHLGLPELEWSGPAHQTLVSPVRSGREKTRTLVLSFADDFNHALDRYLPSSVAELNVALAHVGSDWCVSESADDDGLLIPENEILKVTINPAHAGSNFSSRALAARMAFAKRIAVARAMQFLALIAQLIHPDQIPTLKTGDQNVIPTKRRRSIEDENRPRERRHQEDAPSPEFVGAARPRADRGLRRKDDCDDDRGQTRVFGAGSGIPDDASEFRGGEPETRFSAGRNPRGRGLWLIRLRLLARSLGIRVRAGFDLTAQGITVLEVGKGSMYLNLQTMTLEADEPSPSSGIATLKSSFIAKYGSSFIQLEEAPDNSLEP